MKRILFLGLCVAVCGIGLRPGAAQQTEKKPEVNLEALFKAGDTDGDGKLSKEEFRKLTANFPKLKGKPEVVDAIFQRLDTNKDGFLSLGEFKAITSLQAGASPPAPPVEKPPGTPQFASAITAEQLAFFEKKIRPVLVAQCYECHAADSKKIRGKLVLDTREGLRAGGESGAVIVPGRPGDSLLIQGLRHVGDLKMPPREKLADDVIADFERWVAMGAPDPRDGKSKVVHWEIDIEKGRQFWSFQPPRAVAPPKVKDTAWPLGDIDRFLLAALEARGLTPVADAAPETLIRRVYFDLIGLPPTPEEVDEFLNARTTPGVGPQAALAKVVDKLLASPQFGERWGRHWLDVVRYGESSGRSSNFSYPQAWRYRDYVIGAFNKDKPYNQFLREQLAGDLLPATDDRQRAELMIATGFLALGPKAHNERNPLQFQMDMIDEQIDVTFQALQGLTVACARCHDHKFDPIPTRDYYALAGIFRSTEVCYGTIRTIQSNFPTPLLVLPAGAKASEGLEPMSPAQKAALVKQRANFQEQADKLAQNGERGSVKFALVRIQIDMLDSLLERHEPDGTPKSLAMGVRERKQAANSRIFIRGELDKPGDMVPRGLPQVLTPSQPVIKGGSGRLELSDWMVARANPLTARVMVNRVWLHLFGRGLVPTPDNFGAAGQPPSNQALLDTLAVSFMDNGWSVKQLIRSIMLSHAYQLGSQHQAKNHEVDPENTLIWHMSKRRLEAEALRDAMLAISGQLDLKAPRGSLMLKNGEGFVKGNFKDSLLVMKDRHRSVYLPILRDAVPEVLMLFDFPDPTLVAGERASTTIPAQALYLLNNPGVIQQAQAAADRLLARALGEEERIIRAYRMFLTRVPNAAEIQNASAFLERYAQALAAEGVTPPAARRRAWAALCQALFASAEFAYLE